MSQDLIIKTTARLQEASEPDRHKPIIRIDDRDGRISLSHISDANQLANTIRASIDSGRDNPFKPDGEIYRMTDPIVDFYKLGPSQSGTATPTYADLAQNSTGGAKSGGKKHGDTSTSARKKSSWLWKRRAPPPAPASSSPNGHQIHKSLEGSANKATCQSGPKKRSCWRKWFCCCCCCCSRKQTPAPEAATGGGGSQQRSEQTGRLAENIDHYNTATGGQGAKSQDLIISNSKSQNNNNNNNSKSTTTTTITTIARRSGSNNNNIDENNSTNWDSNSPAAADAAKVIKAHNDEASRAPAQLQSQAQVPAHTRQAKVVIVEELLGETKQNNIDHESKPKNGSTKMSSGKTTNGTSRQAKPEREAGKQTAAPKSSKCVIS